MLWIWIALHVTLLINVSHFYGWPFGAYLYMCTHGQNINDRKKQHYIHNTIVCGKKVQTFMMHSCYFVHQSVQLMGGGLACVHVFVYNQVGRVYRHRTSQSLFTWHDIVRCSGYIVSLCCDISALRSVLSTFSVWYIVQRKKDDSLRHEKWNMSTHKNLPL